MRSLAVLLLLLAQEKKEEKKPEPKILCFVPAAVKAGTTAKVTARGLALDQATAVAGAALKSKGKAQVPNNMDAAVYGDTQVEFEVKVPADAGEIALAVDTPHGKTPARALRVVAADAYLQEKEPNPGFAQAQPLGPGRTVVGAIQGAKDVDVFVVDGKAGETWTFEVEAQRLGSPLDPLLALYTEGAVLMAGADDIRDARDAVLKVTLPSDGRYFLSLQDAHDQGGATHVYVLRASSIKH